MYSTWLILLCCLHAITGATGATTGDEYGSTSRSGIFSKVSSSLEVQGSISGDDVVWLMKILGFKDCHHEENGDEGHGHEGHGDEKEDKSPCNLVCMIFLFLLVGSFSSTRRRLFDVFLCLSGRGVSSNGFTLILNPENYSK